MAEQRRTTRTPKSKSPQPVNDYGRIQPQAPELEEAVLGALMIEKDAYSLVSEILRPESFYEHRHQLIYSAITDLAVDQKPVDILTVKERLAKRGDLEEVGGPFYITPQQQGGILCAYRVSRPYHCPKGVGARADNLHQ